MSMSPDYPKELDKETREKLGMVFTEEVVADFMVDRAFAYLSKDWMKEAITVIEPSVGGGSFYRALIKKIREGISSADARKEVWSRIYGIDIEPSAVALARKNIREIQRQRDSEFFTDLGKNILCRDFLSSTPQDFGIGTSGADLIIGNPPYIGEKGHKELFHTVRQTDFGSRYYEKGMDYFYYFIEKGLELLSENGILAYITTSYWTRADSACKLREAVRRQAGFVEVIDFKDLRLFKDANGQNSMIFILQKNYEGSFFHYTIRTGRKKLTQAFDEIHKMSQGKEKDISPRGEQVQRVCCTNQTTKYFAPYFFFLPNDRVALIRRIEEASVCRLGEVAKINQGIVSGADKVTVHNVKYLSKETLFKENIRIGDGIFVLEEEEKERLEAVIGKARDRLVPFYKNSSIDRYATRDSKRYLLYMSPKEEEFSPPVQNHLRRFKEILERRREVQKGSLPYYALHWSREESMFRSEKIVVPQRAHVPVFAYSDRPFYASADVYFIHQMEMDAHFLLAYLNSFLTEFYLRHMGKRKGSYYELYSRPLSEIPIWGFSESQIKELSDQAKIASHFPATEKGKRAMRCIDEWIEEITRIDRKRVLKDSVI